LVSVLGDCCDGKISDELTKEIAVPMICVGKCEAAVEEASYISSSIHVVELSFLAGQFVNTDECTRPTD
jgi:hypothetical protein